MKKVLVDVAVIGAGSAGLNAYRVAREATSRVVIIEGGAYGTTCARVGCMPSKLLIAAAEAAHGVKQAAEFGVETPGGLKVDGRAVMRRVKAERDRFVSFVEESVDNFPEETKLQGYACFLSDHTLSVTADGGEEMCIEAKAVVIATGSRPHVPPMFSALGDRLLTNDKVFEWDDLPQSVAVFGPGIIGLEIGQALHRLGVRVVILGRGGFVGPLSDPTVLEYATKTFEEELTLQPDAKVSRIEREGDEVVVEYTGRDGTPRVERFDYVLAATGRRPNVDRLSLEKTSLSLDERGMPRFDRYTLQCGQSNIFIAGDANNDLPLLHEAVDEGKIAGANAASYPTLRAGKRRVPLAVVFTDPNIATVGPLHKQLRQGCFATGRASFESQGRSRVMLKNKGLLHVYGELGSGLFLGAEMIAPRAEHIAHLLAWALQQRLTVEQMLEMPFYHPVIEEGVRTALRDLQVELRRGPPVDCTCIDCGPGA